MNCGPNGTEGIQLDFSRGTPYQIDMSMVDFIKLIKQSVESFIEDEALTRGAAIAFYTVTSIAPVLLIVVAIAGRRFRRLAG